VGSQREVDVDVRVIAATHRDLVQMVEDGVFRRDLWARLSLLEIDVPPLRERRADLLSWLGRLVGRWSSERESSPTVLDVPADTVEAALLLPWTENLRGLDRVLRRHLVHGSPRGVLRVEDLDAGDSAAPSPAPADPAPTLRETRPLVRVPTRSPSSVGVVMANGADVGDAAAAASARPRSLTTTDSWGRKPPPDRDTLVAILRSRGSIRGAASALERDRRQIYRWIEAYGVEPDEWRAE
jgi:transcriptional regulator with GAF, ATPase, and Fis domain